MKTSLAIASLAVLVSLSSNASDIKWVKTPFWTAPQKTEFNVKLSAPSASLLDNCRRYSKLIFADNGELNWPGQSERIERYRTTLMGDSPMNVNSYEAEMDLSTPVQDNAYLEVEVNGSNRGEDDILPNYTQEKSISGAYLSDISDFDIKIVSDGSLTQVSRDLKLKDSKILLVKNKRGNLVIKSYGRDLSCDLIEGKIEITASAPGYVALTDVQMNKLHDFYHGKLEEVLNTILSNKEDSPTFKAARLGYQMGQILDEEFNNPEIKKTETRIKALFDILFVPKTLTPSTNLVDINKRKSFRLGQNVEGQSTTVKFNF
jgi:hypothetical protein